MYFDRYTDFRGNGVVNRLPFIKINKKDTDFYETYELGKTRLDLLSNKYYGDPNYDWLILMANPQYGAFEFAIPNGSEIRIPYPLKQTLEQYKNSIKEYKNIQNKK